MGDSGDGIAEGPEEIAPDPKAMQVAVEFVRQWGRHPKGETVDQWHARLVPFVDDKLADELKLTDASSAPIAKVDGDPTGRSTSVGAVEVTVPTTVGDLGLVCLQTDQGWKVVLFDRT